MLDRAHRKLRRGSEPVILPAKAFDLLTFLVENPGRPLSKEEVLRSVWPGTIVEESNLSQNVFLVRKALGAEGQAFIVTLPGRGYQFVAEVMAEQPASSATPDPGSALVETTRSRLLYEEETEDRIEIWRSPLAMGLLAIGGALLAVAGWLGWQRYEDHVGGAPVQIVLADFDGGTGDPVLDRTLQDVLRFGLLQSPFVSVVTPGMTRSLLTQMRHDPQERLTADIARDICERTGSQAVLHGSLVRLGQRFVLTEEATGCADNETIGTAKQNVSAIEDLPAAVGKMAASLRHDMGESRRMIARFNRPLSPENTNSLEALKEFSQAVYLHNLGRNTEATDLLQRAVLLDPRFAAAYFNLYAFSFTTSDAAKRKSYLQKAYELREFATEPTRLAITAYYEGEFTGDLDALTRTFETWTDVYPRDLQAWQGRANVAALLHEFPDAIAASKRALDLDPDNSITYYTLATQQMQNGEYENARNTCEIAIRKGIDTELIRYTLFLVGHLTHDGTLITQQEHWMEGRPPSATFLLNKGYLELAKGRAQSADAFFARAEDTFRQQGDAELGLHYRQGSARAYFESGWPDKARAQLNIAPIPAGAYNTPDDLIALAETGRPDLAASMLQKELADHPRSTRWNRCFAPEIRATIAMLNHKPADALTVMAPMNGAALDNLAYLRGLAYLETNQLSQAEGQFRSVLDHAGVDPTSHELSLADLQMARVLAREGRKDEAIRGYRVFLAAWKDADKDSLTLRAAQAELSALEANGL